MDLALLRESFENGSLSAVIWAETTAQLADAMTKTNDQADSRLLLVLSDGVLRHSYQDALLKISPAFADLDGAKGGVVKGLWKLGFVFRITHEMYCVLPREAKGRMMSLIQLSVDNLLRGQGVSPAAAHYVTAHRGFVWLYIQYAYAVRVVLWIEKTRKH
jgi:hypothetical protein